MTSPPSTVAATKVKRKNRPISRSISNSTLHQNLDLATAIELSQRANASTGPRYTINKLPVRRQPRHLPLVSPLSKAPASKPSSSTQHPSRSLVSSSPPEGCIRVQAPRLSKEKAVIKMGEGYEDGVDSSEDERDARQKERRGNCDSELSQQWQFILFEKKRKRDDEEGPEPSQRRVKLEAEAGLEEAVVAVDDTSSIKRETLDAPSIGS
ncbi:hypothetical protein AX17_007554 [Amanita inopinata Kibby_2008]|nr:hypothetical protein AX17_007554 [Amanita inopinata Kibby_2008]